MAFNARLRELRERANLTQGELAERAGMSKGGIANLEQGIRRPEWDTVQKLAKALGVTCEAFAMDEEGQEPLAEDSKRGRGRPAKELKGEARISIPVPSIHGTGSTQPKKTTRKKKPR